MKEPLIQNLLVDISDIHERYRMQAKKTGENFNIFRILKVESDEVRMHSAFLAELLNPKGSHDLNDIFLRSFIRVFEISGFEKKEQIEANILVEENVGFINDDYSEGGRIDIVIKPKNGKIIVIENKIFAGDQYNQLLRYSKHYPGAHILYLTLDGKMPDISSSGEHLKSSKDYYPISYKEGILVWLEQCLKETSSHPIVKETITQYIHLIKHLTGQTMNSKKTNEIVDTILLSPENINAALLISDSILDVKYRIMDDLKTKLTAREFKFGDIKLQVQFDADKNGGKSYSGFWIFKVGWKYCIYFYFEKDYEVLYVGIDYIDPHNREMIELEHFQKIVRPKLLNIHIGKTINNNNWGWICESEQWNDLLWSEVVDKMPDMVDDYIKRILRSIEAVEM